MTNTKALESLEVIAANYKGFLLANGIDFEKSQVYPHFQILIEALTPQWQPIETAPGDGTEILIYAEERIFPCVWEDRWMRRNGDTLDYTVSLSPLKPTLWKNLDLPTAPKGGDE